MLFVKESISWEQLHDSLYNFLSMLCMFNKLKTKKMHCLSGNRSPDIYSFYPLQLNFSSLCLPPPSSAFFPMPLPMPLPIFLSLSLLFDSLDGGAYNSELVGRLF